jgi:hypothetical protein
MKWPFAGFSWGEVAVIFAVLLFLFAVSRPNIQRHRGGPELLREVCVHHLKYIQAAKTEWGVKNQKHPTDIPIPAELVGTNQMPVCLAGGEYTIGPLNADPRCSLAHEGHKLQ